MFAYHLGDLDDFHFAHCQWAADYHERARIEEAVLIYNGGSIPTVMAFGTSPRFEAFLTQLIELLPGKFHGHYQKEQRSYFQKAYQPKHRESCWKMKFVDSAKVSAVNDTEYKNIIRLNEAHAAELEQVYALAYPDGYFDRRMLHTGKYFGYSHNGRIVSAAGVHVDSAEYGVSVLGSIATLPKFRARGLATRVTARLLKELISQRKVITLNVKAENAPAIKCYANLGFVKTHEYEESLFTLKK